MPATTLRLLACLIALLGAAHAAAAPAQLDEWRDWVLERHVDSTCPWQLGEPPSRVCIWPGRLALELVPRGMDFTYRVEVFQDGAMVPLPGGTATWPLQVTVDTARGAVVDRSGSPYVLLDTGSHVIRGQFRWQRRPASLAVPPGVALVSIARDGRSISAERRGGHIVLGSDSASAAPVKQSNTLGIEVFRKLVDGVPMTLETRVILTVSGEPREVEVGRLAWPDTALMALASPLPARVEDNGNLRVQLRPGRHTLVFRSRFLGAVEQLATSRVAEPWPAYEYLSFAADSDLRQVRLSGAPGIDTSQVPLPTEWRELPTWRLDAGTTLQLATEYRGDQSPGANELAVNRNLWLDFDGGALTGLETVTGAMRRGWRLDARADTRIGSARVAGQPVLVTRHAGAQGVEIRSPAIDLQAVTRIDSPESFSVTGWRSRAERYSATLHLPPGWRVLHAAGVDSVQGSWLSDWDLWDIFLLLIMVAATRKLLGFKAAGLALVALLAGYHEPGMPTGGLALLLLLLPLSAVAGGRTRRGIAVAAALVSVALVLALVAFSIDNFRLAIYPSLERHAVGIYQPSYSPGTALPEAAGMAADFMQAREESATRAAAPSKQQAAEVAPPVQRDAYLVGEGDRVQTGPGVPNWLWGKLQLSASGPVPENAQLSVIYSPPWLTRLWRVFSVLATLGYAGLLLAAVLRNLRAAPPGAAVPGAATSPGTRSAGAAPGGASAALLLLGALALGGLGDAAQARDYPPQHLLDELERRLLQAPACAPHCVALDEGVITTGEATLTIGFSAYAAADVLLPLPTPREGWRVSAVQVDGDSAAPLRQQAGALAVLLRRGYHVVRIEGALHGDIASVSLPLPIHNITASGGHWLLSGLVDGRVPSGTLSLRAVAAVRREAGTALAPDPVEPFFRVDRELDIGLQWRVVTRVTRLAPDTGPVAVAVPLLAFERLLSDNIRVTDGRARLQFGDRQRELSWESSIAPVDSLQLVAAPGTHYVETWRLRPSALWRVDYEGVPPTRAPPGPGSLQPQWQPWPGESLTLDFTRPQGIGGPTYTVEEASLAYQAGSALRQSLLTLNIKASIGQDYVLELPADARVTSLTRNGSALTTPDGPAVRVALQPGEQRIAVGFEQDGGAGWLSTTPQVTLPGGASNITLSYTLPRDRWPLYLAGPDIGPAMLYWGVFCVIVLGAVLLHALDRRLRTGLPVSLPGWLLLGIGLSTVNSYGVLVVAGFFFALAYRQRVGPAAMSRLKFNLMQVVLVLGALLALATLVSAIPLGLLASPNMLVTGNNSSSHLYNFFQDRATADAFPTATVVSVSLLAYRVTMLIWSLWLASRLLRWVAWGWQAYGCNGLWAPRE